jgi:ATP-binding cassette subfamily F protein uup
VLLLDEPTNDLDVATLSALEEMLIEMDGSAVVVTHDRWFLDRVATAILAFEGDGRVVRYAGNYGAYRAQKAGAAARAEPAAPARPSAPAPRESDRPRPLTYAERIELDGILARIEEAEGRVRDIETALADPTLYAARGGEVGGLVADLERAKQDAARLMERWEVLEAKREAAGKG